MKKIVLFLIFGTLLSFTSADRAITNNNKKVIANNYYSMEVKNNISMSNKYSELPGRMCCTRSAVVVVGGQTSIISVTACAGWFLSNSATAYARACRKASEALGQQL